MSQEYQRVKSHHYQRTRSPSFTDGRRGHCRSEERQFTGAEMVLRKRAQTGVFYSKRCRRPARARTGRQNSRPVMPFHWQLIYASLMEMWRLVYTILNKTRVYFWPEWTPCNKRPSIYTKEVKQVSEVIIALLTSDIKGSVYVRA